MFTPHLAYNPAVKQVAPPHMPLSQAGWLLRTTTWHGASAWHAEHYTTVHQSQKAGLGQSKHKQPKKSRDGR